MRLLPWPSQRRPPRALAVLGLILLFPTGMTPTARADDTVRRAQEELRKRNLYFGDIDGAANRGTVGALKRYQERKRLAVTGEPDGETLRSLGIPAPHSESASAPIEPDPWPEVPVLRSDLGRHPPPPPMSGAGVLSEDKPRPAPEVTAATGGPELPAPPPAGGSASWGPSPAPGIAGPPASETGSLSPEAARSFIANYLHDGSTNDLRAEMSYYADVVDYFNKGPAVRDYIQRDVRSYYKRWPQRQYEILGPVTVTPGARPGETALGFQIRYLCRGPGRRAEGRTNNVLTVLGAPGGGMRIVGTKEQRVR